jgi:hypothetical protein
MNCREAQSQIFAEGDSVLDNTQRAALDGHLAQCGDCKRVRDNLTAALASWRTEASHVAIPDVEREWHAVRRRIRGGTETGAERTARPRRNVFAWLAVPLGAAAAVALTLYVSPRSTSKVPPAASVDHVARANSVEVPGNNATTMVFVDEKSGWLFVLASDATPQQG